jgi:hypothetical protein
MTTLVEEMAKAMQAADETDGVFSYPKMAQAALDCVLRRLREPDDGLVDVVWGMLPPDCNTAVLEITEAIATHLDQERSRE